MLRVLRTHANRHAATPAESGGLVETRGTASDPPTAVFSTAAKALFSLLALTIPYAAYLDPTFGGLVNLNPMFARQAFAFTLLSCLTVALLSAAFLIHEIPLRPRTMRIFYLLSLVLLMVAIGSTGYLSYTTARLDSTPLTDISAAKAWGFRVQVLYGTIVVSAFSGVLLPTLVSLARVGSRPASKLS